MNDPVKTEATTSDGDTIDVDWEGITVTVPATADDWDPDVLEAFENGKAIAAVKGLLGVDTYERVRRQFRKTHGRKMVVRDLNDLMETVAAVYGFESAGN